MLQYTLLVSIISLATAGFIDWQELGDQNKVHHKQLRWPFSKTQELPKPQETYNVCRTKECFRIAAEFWESMNKSVDPCEDFYEYSCGNWETYNPIPPNEMSWSPMAKMQKNVAYKVRDFLEESVHPDDVLPVKQVKKFYQSCMNVDDIEQIGIKPLEGILVRSGGWPMIMEASEWNPEEFSWKQVHDYYSHLSKMSALYSISVSKDLRGIEDTSDEDDDDIEMIIKIEPPNLPSVVLESGEEFSRSNMYKDGSYKKFIKEVALIFAAEREAHIEEDQLEKDVEEIIEIEKLLSHDNEYFFDLPKYYDFDGLQERYDNETNTPGSQINWRKTIADLFAEANVEIEGSEIIQVKPDDFLSKLSKLLDNKSPRVLVNYIHWHFLSNMLPYTSSKIQELEYKIKKEQAGIKEETPRWKTCVDNIKMQHAVSYLFVKKYFDDKMRIDTENIIAGLKKQMTMHILKADWLDDSVRKMELDKLKKMRINIGYPEWYNNSTMLNNHYRGIPVGHNFLSNILSFQRYSLKRNLKSLKEKPKSDEWVIHPIVVNAFYLPDYNSLTIPAADFQVPFYTMENLQTINYAALGFVMGHEVSHGFDDTGFQYDQNGNEINWPTEIQKTYENKAKCFVNQLNDLYEDFLALMEEETSSKSNSSETSEQIDLGTQKLGENIADTLGLDTVFDAFEDQEKNIKQARLPGFEDLSNEQLFFLNFAKLWCENSTPAYETLTAFFDSHSKARNRVISSLQNSEGFAKAYNCPLGSKMNPARKCKLWK